MGLFDKKEMQESKKKGLPTQTGLCIRMIASLYLLYLSYDLFQTRDASSMPFGVLCVILAVFVLCSIFIIAHAIYLYVTGRYVGGKADVDEEDAEDDNLTEDNSNN